ncbi:hypothetical protein [Paludibaculum fermentans]|uniref:Uncharacterized protein n=1 Tax=Paludibaculum fermentans TaxID=1473598 RepID=A0A7S7SPJ8_PALFE|nr:hypothetical protein [Paludibaculum fermentans]QOY91210.1 hypothetical protein IRI77_15055 [Paludibaculum fermentans]
MSQRFQRSAVMILLGVLMVLPVSVAAQIRDADPSAAEEVVLMPVGPYGEKLDNCKVASFLFQGAPQHRNVERRSLFNGLVGKAVPFGPYLAYLTCDVPKGVRSITNGVASSVRVQHRSEFLVISSHRHIMHYQDGGPRLQVRIEGAFDTSGSLWVKLVGTFLNEVAVAKVGRDGVADIVVATPGDHVLLVLATGKLVCTKSLSLASPWDQPGERYVTINVEQGCQITRSYGAVSRE